MSKISLLPILLAATVALAAAADEAGSVGDRAADAGHLEAVGQWRQAGEAHARQGNAEKARECLVRAAAGHEEKGEWEEAAACYRDAALHDLSRACLARAAQILEREGSHAAAGDRFRQAGEHLSAARCYGLAARAPGGEAAWRPAGDAHLRAGDVARARQCFLMHAQWLEETGDLRGAGGSFRLAGDAARAAACLLLAADRLEGQGDWRGAADCRREAGRADLAAELLVADAQRLLQAGDPGGAADRCRHAGDFRQAADCHELAGNHAAAADCHGLAGDPAAAARCHELAGDFRQAARCHGLAGNPGDAARCHELAGDFRQAAATYRSMGQDLLFFLAAARIDAPSPWELVDLAEMAAAHAPGDRSLHARRALLAAHRGDLALSLRALAAVLDLAREDRHWATGLLAEAALAALADSPHHQEWAGRLLAARQRLDLGASPLPPVDLSDGLVLHQLSAALGFSDDLGAERRWNATTGNPAPPPDLRTAIAILDGQAASLPADSPRLVRLALRLRHEIGPDGRILPKWPKDAFPGQWRLLSDAQRPASVTPAFAWALGDASPAPGNPPWLREAARIEALRADTPEAAAAAVASLEGHPDLLADFAVAHAFRHPADTALVAALGCRPLPPGTAEAAFARWRELATARLVGLNTAIGESELRRRLDEARGAVLANPFWIGRQQRAVMALDRGFNAKNITHVNALLDLAAKAAAGGQQDLAFGVVRAALLWHCTENDPSLDVIAAFSGAVARDETPPRRRLFDEDRGLIYLHNAVFRSGYRPCLRHAAQCFRDAGDGPVGIVGIAACADDLESLARDAWQPSPVALADPTWATPLALARWLMTASEPSP
jgi:tetratricopeptide (TPR) repeat protein